MRRNKIYAKKKKINSQKSCTACLSARFDIINSKPALRGEHPVFKGDGLSGSIEASVAMHGFFLYAVFFNGSLAALGAEEDSLSFFPLFILQSTSISSFVLSWRTFALFSFLAGAVFFPPLARSLALVLLRSFFLLPASSASLSSALLFPALVEKPSGPFARRSPLARAARRHIIFSVFLLRGNLSSGEPVERGGGGRGRGGRVLQAQLTRSSLTLLSRFPSSVASSASLPSR